MSSLNTVTGRGGTVSYGGSTIARITQWSVTDSLDTSTDWGDSDGGGYTNRAAGRRGASCDCEGKYDSVSATDATDLFGPGDVAAVICASNGGPGYTFTRALCTSFGITVNIDTEEVIGWTANFGSDGTYTAPN